MYRSIISWFTKRVRPVSTSGKKFPRYAWAFWALPILFVLLSYLLIFKDLPSPAKLAQYNVPIATKIYDRNGKLLFDIFADQNRTPVGLSEMTATASCCILFIKIKTEPMFRFQTFRNISSKGQFRLKIKTSINIRGLMLSAVSFGHLLPTSLTVSYRVVLPSPNNW